MKTVAEMAREAGIDAWWDSGDERREVLQEHLERLADLVRADEREACAQVGMLKAVNGIEVSAAIRARGNT